MNNMPIRIYEVVTTGCCCAASIQTVYHRGVRSIGEPVERVLLYPPDRAASRC